MCNLLLSAFIAGAMETAPGLMTVDYMLNYGEVETIQVPTQEYLACWEYPYLSSPDKNENIY